jgi:hypothetical protein
MMIPLVIIANRNSLMGSFFAAGEAEEPVSNGTDLAGELVGELRGLFMPFGRHCKTASTEALQGCNCSGYENITRITMAAFAIVEATEGISTEY